MIEFILVASFEELSPIGDGFRSPYIPRPGDLLAHDTSAKKFYEVTHVAYLNDQARIMLVVKEHGVARSVSPAIQARVIGQ